MTKLRARLKDIKLYYCYACRRLGISGYEVHQIYLPEHDLLYIPIPKNACSSTKHALYEIEFGKEFDYDLIEDQGFEDIHDYYKKRTDAFTSISELKTTDSATRFAIVRDPVERLISCYRNRVVDLGDLQSTAATLERMGLPLEPDLNTFVRNLRRYRKANKIIEHHSRPQYRFLGGTLQYLDRIFPIERMEDLKKMLKEHAPYFKMKRKKSGGTDLKLTDLSEKALMRAIKFYRRDYKILRQFYSPQKVRDKFKRLLS